MTAKDSKRKFIWSGNNKGTDGVGVMLAKRLADKVFEVKRISARILMVQIVVGKMFTVVCIYAPQVGLSENEKNDFYEQLQSLVANVPASEELFVHGDCSGHIGSNSDEYNEWHGGQAIGQHNPEGERVHEFAVANDSVISISHFKKHHRHLVTFQSGDVSTD